MCIKLKEEVKKKKLQVIRFVNYEQFKLKRCKKKEN